MVRPKKRFGQHFLTDRQIARRIVQQVDAEAPCVVEIGPGTGALTELLLERLVVLPWAVEMDTEVCSFLKKKYPALQRRLIQGDALTVNWAQFGEDITVVGNFPYNISSQLLFALLPYHSSIKHVVCMLQKEVAMRITSARNSRAYGILSVLLQAYYHTEFLFEVPFTAFFPRPKVTSAVIRLTRNAKTSLDCDEQAFRTVVKRGFQNRRKTLRNALKTLNLSPNLSTAILFDKRAEQLSVEDFEALARQLKKIR